MVTQAMEGQSSERDCQIYSCAFIYHVTLVTYIPCYSAKRTVAGYAQAGLAGIMIEDQVSPKKCGHTKGKSVVSRDEAVMRVRAACDARDEGSDIVVMARTDARGCVSMDEAIARCLAFKEAGADITFLEVLHMNTHQAITPGAHSQELNSDIPYFYRPRRV
jgi:hypothetical protein